MGAVTSRYPIQHFASAVGSNKTKQLKHTLLRPPSVLIKQSNSNTLFLVAQPRLAESLLMRQPAGPIEIRGLETTSKS